MIGPMNTRVTRASDAAPERVRRAVGLRMRSGVPVVRFRHVAGR